MSIKMKTDKIQKTKSKLMDEIEIPEDITVVIEDGDLIMKKNGNELKRKLNPAIGLKITENKILIKPVRITRKEKKIFGTFKAHIKNMIKGLSEGFEYKLQIANVHFPMNVNYDKENREIVVKNFLGEKKDRRIKITSDVDININKDIVEVRSIDIEKAGQTAANIEKGTKVRNRDRRIYQDGIFIIEKPGRSFL